MPTFPANLPNPMKRIFLLLCLLSVPCFAQLSSTGSITASGSTCGTTNACVSLSLFNTPTISTTAASIVVSGTYSGTNQFEGSADGINFTAINGIPLGGGSAVTSTTSTGTWNFGISALSVLRVRASAYASGTATVTIQASAGTGGTTTAGVIAGGMAAPATGTTGQLAVYTSGTAIGSSNTITADVYFKSGRPWIDVKAYGAVGDGVTVDKTAIQNAINACPTSPAVACIVYFPNGNYQLGGAGGIGLTINTGATGQNNVCMVGESYGGQGGTRITYTGSSGSGIAVGSNSQSTSGFCLQDISIVLATGVTASTNGLTLTRVNHVELKRVRIDGTTTAAQYGIQITANTGNSQFVQIEEPDIQGIFTNGIQIDGSSSPPVTATTIIGGNIQKTGGVTGNGINCAAGDSTAVYNTDIEGWAIGINSTCNKDYWGARLEANTIAILNNPTASQDQDAPIMQDGTSGAQINDYGINTRRLDLVAAPSNSFEVLKDDFIGGTCSDGSIGELGWRLRTIGSVPACSSGGASMTIGLLGNMEILTNAAATAGQGGTLALDTQGGFTGDLSSVGQWQLEFRFKINQTTATRFRIGFLNGAGDTTVAPTDGMWLRYDTNVGFADTNFMFETCKASTCSSVSTGVAAESTLFHRVRILSPSAGSLAFQLDGGTPITFCASGCTVTSSNVPTVTQAVGLQLATDATAQKAAFVNKFSFFIKNLQRN